MNDGREVTFKKGPFWAQTTLLGLLVLLVVEKVAVTQQEEVTGGSLLP